MGRIEGKVALITGAARGQGRSHAVRLSEEGADIVAVDSLGSYATMAYPMSEQADLDETVRLVEQNDRRIIPCKADIRSREQMQAVVRDALAEFGQIDIVVANAGVGPPGMPFWTLSEEQWDETLSVNLKGAWITCSAVVPAMIEAGNGGSIIVTSSAVGMKAMPNLADYNSSKSGVIGLTRTMANELAPYYIRANVICPTAVATKMLLNDTLYRLFRPDLESPGEADVVEPMRRLNAIPEPWVEPRDISNAVLWLASEEARYVTGAVIPVDLGNVNKV